ncbi:MAG TPA: polyprenol phosphomannose-dependent alpha 1,6 mannosyltransferase MptB [Pseudonocardiaceae bacterium]|nr:polyprenol phosphomannose-dependent alpha 1,6 mannosyltransferase MptB [Pseudonocardiaceae bacterium]
MSPSSFLLGSGLSRRTLIQGLIGSLLIVAGSLGAGGILIQDPILGNGPLGAMRYGHGQALATIAVYVGVGLLVWAWVRLGRDVLADRVRARGVVLTAAAWIAPMIVSPPQFTRDPFSYLGQGELALHGLDPYVLGPGVLGDAIAANVHPFWQFTPAPYGPMFIEVAKLIVGFTGEHLILGVIAMRLTMMLGLVLLAWSLPGLARHLGGKLPVAFWVLVANPLTVIHLVGGPHNDLLMIGLLAVGVLLTLDGRHFAGIAVVTLAGAIKASALIALPFLVWVWAARLPGSKLRRFTLATVASIGTFGVVFGASMLVSGQNFGWIGALNAPTMISNWVNLPTGLGELMHGFVSNFGDLPEAPFVNMSRTLADLTLVIILLVQWWRARNGGVDAVRRAGVTLLCTAILAPPTLPWYLTWGLVILCALPWSRRMVAFTAGVTVVAILVYYPNGEAAMFSVGHMGWVALGGLLALVSILRPDPLRLRGRSRRRAGSAGSADETASVPTLTTLPLNESAGSAGSNGDRPVGHVVGEAALNDAELDEVASNPEPV